MFLWDFGLKPWVIIRVLEVGLFNLIEVVIGVLVPSHVHGLRSLPARELLLSAEMVRDVDLLIVLAEEQEQGLFNCTTSQS